MNKKLPGLLAGTAALALAVPLALGVPAQAEPRTGADPAPGAGPGAARDGVRTDARPDNRPGPLTARQQQLKEKALALLASGDARATRRADGGSVVAVPQGPDRSEQGRSARGGQKQRYYEFPVDKTAQVFTILSEFGGTGPANNEIAEPGAGDNSTYWVDDFDKAHYEEMFNGDGESFKNYYSQASSGRYTAVNTVEDWVRVPGDAATYGANDVEDDGGSWAFIGDTADAWYDAQRAAGRSDAEIRAYLARFDEWDRYDHDGDGDFNEPDGYIDHFQAIHAGEGEEAGGGAQGEDAIWSHRWYVNGTDYGSTGPDGALFGGTQIGDSGMWIGDYTVEPENGGLGVFTHEFGHDLGLPDYYDTAGGDNGSSFWTLMSAGSWLGHGDDRRLGGDGIGTTPGGLGPEEKLELGWLDHTEVDAGETFTGRLGPAVHTYDDPATTRSEADQAIKINLPDKETTTVYTTPPSGSYAWWSGRGDDLNQTLTTAVPAGDEVTVSAKAWYDIEAGYDYLYGEYSTDGGTTWTDAGTPVSGSSDDAWEDLTWTYDAGGAPTTFRFRYATDGGVNEAGAFLDDITLSAAGTTVVDGAESTDSPIAWQVRGWTRSTGTDTKTTQRYYLLENRQHVGYDATLGTGPYQFSKPVSSPDTVEFFSFRPGMVVWYVDDAYADNNTSAHSGAGAALPVDARSAPMRFEDGTKPGNRRQPFDAAFGLATVPRTCLHTEKARPGLAPEVLTACAPRSKGIATFTDRDPNRYWTADNPQGSVKVAGVGVTATVVKDADGFLTVKVVNPAG